MFSDLPAEHILASHKREMAEEEAVKKAKPPSAFSTGIKIVRNQITIHYYGCLLLSIISVVLQQKLLLIYLVKSY